MIETPTPINKLLKPDFFVSTLCCLTFSSTIEFSFKFPLSSSSV